MTGTIGILNVGAGDTKLSFDPSDPAECIRAARIVKDMLRRGYALLVATGEKDGRTIYQRVHDFKEGTCEYIIADFDPVTAEADHQKEHHNAGAAEPVEILPPPRPADKGKRGRKLMRAIPASTTSGISVARTAGG